MRRHLERQLASRGEDEGADRSFLAGRGLVRVLEEVMEDGKAVREGFTGALIRGERCVDVEQSTNAPSARHQRRRGQQVQE